MPRAQPARPASGPGPSRLWGDAAWLFLALWLLYGAGINKLNLQAYTLYPEMVQAIAEQGTFVIGHEQVPKENDRFLFEGKVLPAKQPLIFAIGAVAYVPSRWLGLTFERDYFLATAVLTWLTASLLAAAAAAAALVLAVRIWGFLRREALCAVIGGATCTTLLPYAGIPHHDIAAMAMLMLALLAFETARQDGGPGRWRIAVALVAGVFLGLTLGFSMLPAAIVFGVIVAVAATRRLSIVLPAGLGFLAGLLPMALYNLHYFHTPFVQANLAGGFEDTYPGFDLPRIAHHLNAYLGLGEVSLLKYAPIVLTGAVGVVLLAARRRSPGRLLLALLLLHGAYVLSIATIGHCQYGPRYLIPAIPLAALGLAPLLEAVRQSPSHGVRRGGALLVAVTALASLAVNLVGTIGGTMYCTIKEFALPRYLAVLSEPQSWKAIPGYFPLAGVCLPGLALVAMAWLARRVWTHARLPPSA